MMAAPKKQNELAVDLGCRDIETGLTLLNTIVCFIESQEEDLILVAISAMVQKAGAHLERGFESLGADVGIIGGFDAWMTGPSERRARNSIAAAKIEVAA